jgi:plastocyanin
MEKENTKMFRNTHVILVGLVLAACANLPETTRTGVIRDVKIEQGVSPADLVAQIGDEVRWVNHRSGPVRIHFLGGALNHVSCAKGFTNFLGMKKESATIKADESSSLCFAQPGFVSYNVRMTDMVPGGERLEFGTIHVGSIPQPEVKGRRP